MAGSFLESSVQFDKESTWGTAVMASPIRLPVLTWNVLPSFDIYESGMITGAAGASAPAWGVKRVAGSFTLEGGYNSLDIPLLGVLGSGSNTAGASDPFTNRYVPSASLPSFTAHVSYGDVPTDKVIEFQGLKFNSVELSWDAAQGFMNVSCDVIGQEADSNGATGVAEVAPAITIVHEPINVTPSAYVTTNHIGVGTDKEYCVRSGSIRIERFLTTNRICVGTDTIKEPVPDRPMRVSGTFNVEFIDLDAYAAFANHTVATATQFKWDGGTHSVDIVMPKVVYTSALPPIQAGDVLVAPINWIAYGTGGSGATAEPINVTVESSLDYDSI